eukprot:CAMPEP_0175376836 /NCGR_PEP_ID=MMETSP0095-20121207/24480_1 /TAXON_ID=311494 /ORGANISM="Alexandrium monilatum, Strain CCMP3105" /LENGTH=151 /DNA_ID=CAMNT_0016675131 /DNA_START=599 /DNA_END=1055 /DNA_ORIENTATION=-
MNVGGLDGGLQPLEVEVGADHGPRVRLLLRRALLQVVLPGSAHEHEGGWLLEGERAQAVAIPWRLASCSHDAHQTHLVMRNVQLRVEPLLQLAQRQRLPVRRREDHRHALAPQRAVSWTSSGPPSCASPPPAAASAGAVAAEVMVRRAASG